MVLWPAHLSHSLASPRRAELSAQPPLSVELGTTLAIPIGFSGRFHETWREGEEAWSLLAYTLANSNMLGKGQSVPCLAIQYTGV